MKGLFSICLVLLFGTIYANNIPARIEFINGSLGLAIEKAGSEGKLLFVEFGAQWCMPCKFMEENTFKNKEVVDYMNANYVPVKIDIDDFDGFAYKQQYKVEALPTFIIFDSSGKVVERYESSMAPSNLIQILESHDIPANRKKVNTNLSSYEIQAQLLGAKKNNYNVSPYQSQKVEESLFSTSETHQDLSQNSIQSEDNNLEDNILAEQKLESRKEQMTGNTSVEISENYLWEEEESYEFVQESEIEMKSEESLAKLEELIQFEAPKITFYTVQVGTFANERSKDEFVKATSALFIEDTHIFENRFQNHSTFEVCLGAFATEKSASAFLERLQLLNVIGKIKTIEE